MKQSRAMSLVESISNIAVGYGIQCLAFWLFLPLFGFTPSLSDTLLFGLIMTVVSVARSYLLRRLFEALHIRRPLSPFMQAVIAERYRQIEGEGWSTEHDDRHERGDLASAGGCYAHCAGVNQAENAIPPAGWPWDGEWWKPTGFRRDLVKAAALIVAEGEKFDRQRKSKVQA